MGVLAGPGATVDAVGDVADRGVALAGVGPALSEAPDRAPRREGRAPGRRRRRRGLRWSSWCIRGLVVRSSAMWMERQPDCLSLLQHLQDGVKLALQPL